MNGNTGNIPEHAVYKYDSKDRIRAGFTTDPFGPHDFLRVNIQSTAAGGDIQTDQWAEGMVMSGL